MRTTSLIASMLCVGSLFSHTGISGGDGFPVHELTNVGAVREWTLVGPFPNQSMENPPGACPREGFYIDYLAGIGGEGQAEIGGNCVVKYKGAGGLEKEVKAQTVKADSTGNVDLKKAFPDSDYRVAYAYAVIKADKEQRGYFRLGSDDGAKVWVNGKLVLEKACVKRVLRQGEDAFEAELKPGLNRLLVKVENGSGGWGFSLECYDAPFVEVRKQEESKEQHSTATHEKAYGVKFDFLGKPQNLEVMGAEIGIISCHSHRIDGFQTAPCYCAATDELNGMQFSVVNYAQEVNGIQCGLVNVSKTNGVQLGLVNIIKNGVLPFCPIVNFSY